jgi:hypothetical protein
VHTSTAARCCQCHCASTGLARARRVCGGGEPGRSARLSGLSAVVGRRGACHPSVGEVAARAHRFDRVGALRAREGLGGALAPLHHRQRARAARELRVPAESVAGPIVNPSRPATANRSRRVVAAACSVDLSDRSQFAVWGAAWAVWAGRPRPCCGNHGHALARHGRRAGRGAGR